MSITAHITLSSLLFYADHNPEPGFFEIFYPFLVLRLYYSLISLYNFLAIINYFCSSCGPFEILRKMKSRETKEEENRKKIRSMAEIPPVIMIQGEAGHYVADITCVTLSNNRQDSLSVGDVSARYVKTQHRESSNSRHGSQNM